MPLNSEAAILKRLIESETDDLPSDAAHFLLKLSFLPEDLERMDALAAKARSGSLTDEERIEIESYEHVGHLLALLQSKARRAISKRSLGAAS